MSEFDTPMGSTSAEVLDFSNDGVKTEEKLWDVVASSIETTDNGKRWVVEFNSDGQPQTERFWLEHENADAQRIGRGQARKLALALVGTPAVNPTAIIGMKIYATISEDKQGFTRLGKWKQVAKEVAPTL